MSEQVVLTTLGVVDPPPGASAMSKQVVVTVLGVCIGSTLSVWHCIRSLVGEKATIHRPALLHWFAWQLSPLCGLPR